jgi:hypothetical protein
MNVLGVLDLIVAPILFVFMYFFARNRMKKNIELNPSYRYYLPALMVKILGGTGVCLIYSFYYEGGDTTYYFHDSSVTTQLFLHAPFDAIIHSITPWSADNYLRFINIGDIPYYSYDANALFISKILWPLNFIGFQSYIGQTMWLAFFSFFPMWRLYQVFLISYPSLSRQLAIAFFFIPSVFFWGSGLLKDTVTLACVAAYASSFYRIFVQKKQIFLNLLIVMYASYLIVNIKPYILFALLPGTSIWLNSIVLSKIESISLRRIFVPFSIIVAIGFGAVILKLIGSNLGQYKVGNVLNKAVVTQQDLKREEYGGASFDIGDFDPSFSGILSKAPLAINAALFRPYLWEARNSVMIFSGLENIVLIGFSILLLLRLKVINLFTVATNQNLLSFSLVFSLFFAFSIGLTTSNFGSLVRYKIPAMPFFLASLFILQHLYQAKRAAENAAHEKEKVL